MATSPFTTQMTKLASSLGLSEDELYRKALISFLQAQKREILQTRIDVLARYSVDSVAELEEKIASSEIAEHPAWEDLIIAENLDSRLVELNDHLVVSD